MSEPTSAVAGPVPHPAKGKGTILILLGGMFLSTDGVLIRFLEVSDPWTVLFYRCISFVALALVVIFYRHRGRTVEAFRKTGMNGILLALTLGCGFSAYVFGMMLTTVANVSFIISAGPLCAAVLGWLILRERVAPITCLVIAGAVVGMGLMFSDGMSTGQLTGNLIALLAPITFGLMIVLIRRAGEVDMLPATCMAGVVSGIAGFAFSGSLAVSQQDLLLLLFLGAGQLGLGFMLITVGTRYVPAAEAALLALVESILAPILAWLVVNEIPTPLALVGGIIVLSCVIIQGVVGVFSERRRVQ